MHFLAYRYCKATLRHFNHAKYTVISWRSWKPCEMDSSHDCSLHGGKSVWEKLRCMYTIARTGFRSQAIETWWLRYDWRTNELPHRSTWSPRSEGPPGQLCNQPIQWSFDICLPGCVSIKNKKLFQFVRFTSFTAKQMKHRTNTLCEN